MQTHKDKKKEREFFILCWWYKEEDIRDINAYVYVCIYMCVCEWMLGEQCKGEAGHWCFELTHCNDARALKQLRDATATDWWRKEDCYTVEEKERGTREGVVVCDETHRETTNRNREITSWWVSYLFWKKNFFF